MEIFRIIYYIIFQYFGTPINIDVKLQLNIELEPIPDEPLMESFSNTLIPIVWFEEQVRIEGSLLNLLQTSIK